MSLQTSVEHNTQGGPTVPRYGGWGRCGASIPLPLMVCRLPWIVPGRAGRDVQSLLSIDTASEYASWFDRGNQQRENRLWAEESNLNYSSSFSSVRSSAMGQSSAIGVDAPLTELPIVALRRKLLCSSVDLERSADSTVV